MKSNFFNRVVNLIAISKQKKIIEKNIIFFSMTFLEMAALFNFMFLMEMLIFFYKHQQKADHKESTGNPDHSDSIAYGQISTNAGTQGKHKDDSKIIHRRCTTAQITDTHSTCIGISIYLAEGLYLHCTGERCHGICQHIVFGWQETYCK